ncbi:MAG: hypothetical protein IIV97_05120 [Oscillospiraceae bacterium]|nr:hypothetical protein [Oscillospiraceae bacterium]
MKKFLLPFLALFLALLAGCSDYNELNMQELVRNVGVDFENGEVLVTVSCEGEEEKETTIKKARGKSFFEAVRSLSETSGKKLYWGHLQTVVFGEEALSRVLNETIDALSRARDVYSDVLPVAAVGLRAEQVVSENEDVLGAFSNGKNSRRFSEVPIWELARQKELYGVAVIPTVGKINGAVAISGGAVVSDKGVAGILSGEELLLSKLISDEGAGGYLPTVDLSQDRAVSFEILANSVKIKREGKGFSVLQKITVSPAEVKGNIKHEEMKKACEKYLADGYESLMARAKAEKLGNILKFYKTDENTQIEIRTEVTVSNVFGGE